MSRMSPGVLAPPHEVLTPQEWYSRGRGRRRAASRSRHAAWEAPAERPDPVTILEEQAKPRVPGLVAIRNGQMMASPKGIAADQVATGDYYVRQVRDMKGKHERPRDGCRAAVLLRPAVRLGGWALARAHAQR